MRFPSKEKINARRVLLDATEGIFSKTVDFSLWFIAFTLHVSAPQGVSGQVFRAQWAADRFLERVNYDVIKDALKHAQRRGWLTKTRKRHALPEITEEGKKRLKDILPHYDEKRIWDGAMHLVTYDIPEPRSVDRQFFREYLRRMGCGRLQDSVWMTPYNPIDTIRAFVSERGLAGTVIVSNVGKDGAIGEEDIHSLVVQVYGLEELNDRYEQWLNQYQFASSVDHWALIQYLSILRDDPQLPFSLLPHWWLGDKAYDRVKPWLEKV